MKKKGLFVIILFALCAFSIPADEDFPPRFVRKMLQLVKQRPQEKVYLHTDRDHYEAGEKVWLRAYLTNSFTHQVTNFSRYVYVELRDRQDSLYCRVKLAMRDSAYFGYMPLPEKAAQGDYFLRAYSFWMQNAGDEYIFRKKICVLNPRDTKVKTDIACEETDKGTVARIRFYNSRQEPYDKVWVDYILDGKTKIARTDEKGDIRFKLDTADYGQKVLVRFKEGNPFDYERYVYLPDPGKDFDVAFMPEGGHLLSGCQQVVAFKAIGRDGLSRDVSGFIVNDADEQVAFVQSLHKGMGAIDLKVEPGVRYYAVLTSADSVQKRFPLPVAKTDAIALRLMTGADVLGYIVMAADSARVEEDLYLVAHSRGVPLMCLPVQAGARGKLSMKELPEGIVHLLVMNGKGDVFSQRLCFVRHTDRPEITLQTDKQAYHARDLVQLGIQLSADSTVNLSGSFSIAITDDSQVERDSLRDNILSYMLLTSDLKGYIEEPAWYFKNQRIVTRRYLDMLMLTQGWTRFDVSRVLHEDYDTLNYYMERGQAISGRVKNFWGKDATNANLMLLSTSGMFRMVDADSSGHFMIDGIAFPDSTNFILQGKSKKGRRSVEVVIDRDEFMAPSVHMPFGLTDRTGEDDFYKRFSKDYYYDNGVKVYVLDEAVVKRKVVRKSYSFYDNMADYNLDSARLATMGVMDMRQVLQEIPGVEAWGDSVKRFGKPVYLLVNDFEEDLNYVLLMQPQDLVSISFIRPPTSTTFWGQRAENGAIVITTNPHFVPRDIPKLNMVSFSLLGYQKKAEFYMPRYDVDSVRLALADTSDLRSTIYWNPNVCTDATGKAACFYTTSDSYGPYTVIIEGILNNGTVCRKEERIKLKTY